MILCLFVFYICTIQLFFEGLPILQMKTAVSGNDDVITTRHAFFPLLAVIKGERQEATVSAMID